MIELYYAPGACSMAIHVILNELGIPFEAKKIDMGAGEAQKPEFLKINPRGQVPVIVTDGQTIREGAAIMLYLIDEHKSNLLPRSGKLRATALEWLMFGNASMHPAYGRLFFIMKSTVDEKAKDQLYKAALEQVNKLWADVEAQLEKSRFVCGNDITAADILLTVIANWSSYLPEAPTLGKNVKRLLKEVSARPSYQKALKTEQVEYKAAA